MKKGKSELEAYDDEIRGCTYEEGRSRRASGGREAEEVFVNGERRLEMEEVEENVEIGTYR